MGEKEEARVLARFEKEVDEHVGIIKDDAAKGDIEDAVLWVNELLAMRSEWEVRSRRVSAMGIWTPGRGEIEEARIRNEAARIASARVAILDTAIRKAKALIESKS